jgi:hypothetical protein
MDAAAPDRRLAPHPRPPPPRASCSAPTLPTTTRSGRIARSRSYVSEGGFAAGDAAGGGMAFAHHHCVGLPGFRQRDDGPFQRSLEQGRYAGESPWGSVIHVLWGRNGLVLPVRGFANAAAHRASVLTHVWPFESICYEGNEGRLQATSLRLRRLELLLPAVETREQKSGTQALPPGEREVMAAGAGRWPAVGRGARSPACHWDQGFTKRGYLDA